jgi:hypothetical protein
MTIYKYTQHFCVIQLVILWVLINFLKFRYWFSFSLQSVLLVSGLWYGSSMIDIQHRDIGMNQIIYSVKKYMLSKTIHGPKKGNND